MKTSFLSTDAAEKDRKWFIVDANEQVVGRVATKIASTLRGKNKPGFTPHVDCGDFVVVVNAEKIRFTGEKTEKKVYRHHTGFIGGLVEETASDLLARKPEEVIRLAVKGMLPKTALGGRQLKKLKIYTGAEHPHEAQTPESLI